MENKANGACWYNEKIILILKTRYFELLYYLHSTSNLFQPESGLI